MKKFSLNRDIKRQISGVSFYLGGGEGEREGERKKRTCLPLTTPPLLARILAVICAKLRGCIFSSAFWDCIPRIASNFWGPSPPPRLAILSTTMVCVHTHARAYTHTHIYILVRTSVVRTWIFSSETKGPKRSLPPWWTLLGGGKWSGKRNKFFLKGEGTEAFNRGSNCNYGSHVLFWDTRGISWLMILDPIPSSWNSSTFFLFIFFFFTWLLLLVVKVINLI